MEMTYAIVSESEADLAAKKISATSPIGRGLLGKAISDVADIQTPNGILPIGISHRQNSALLNRDCTKTSSYFCIPSDRQ